MKRVATILLVLFLATVLCGEHEKNRFNFQESQNTPEYKEKIAAQIKESKENKVKGINVSDDEKLKIHIVSHSHDDVGFKKTLDQYYSGSNEMVVRAGVQYILDEVIQHLDEDPTKRFVYAEMAFFTRWWDEQNEDMKNTVRRLVTNGQLEFINGGWSMNDEATTYYEDIITNMQKGHQFLLEEFGVTPNVGWHLDPFGHSNAQAALFSRMGFDAWYFCRIDYRDKEKRRDESNLEFLWTPFLEDRGDKDSIFTHITYDMYWGIPNFYFGDSRTEDPIVPGFTLDQRLDEFASWVYTFKDTFKTNNIFIPFGGDFNYQNAATIFINLDRLIKYANERFSDMDVFYSTPNTYIEEVMKTEGVEWSTNSDDFFPYADDKESYWTGFFTSRANQKGYIREASRQYMASNQFLAIEAVKKTIDSNKLAKQEVLEDALSIAQHHDAATGTSKQFVADDYIDYLYNGIKASEEAQTDIMKDLIDSSLDWTFCDVKNGTLDD